MVCVRLIPRLDYDFFVQVLVFFEWCYIAEGQLAGRKVYVGGLLEEVKKEDIMRVFDHFGTIDDVWVARNPYAFITIFKLIFLL